MSRGLSCRRGAGNLGGSARGETVEIVLAHQRPVAIKVVDQLPRTPSLKISRPLVREHYFDGFTPDGAPEVPGAATTGEPS